MSIIRSLVPAAAVLLLVNYSFIASADENSPFTDDIICKVGIAKVTDRSPAIIHIDDADGEVIYLSYRDTNDEKASSYKCRIDGDRILWGNNPGRWRTLPMDSRVYFRIEGNTVHIEISGGH